MNRSNAQDVEKSSYWNAYHVGTINQMENFDSLTAQEKRHIKNLEYEELALEIDTVFAQFFTPTFEYNRCRTSIEYYSNDELNREFVQSEQPSSCICYLDSDTITVVNSIGFFGGCLISIKLHGGEFSSEYYEWADGEFIYKSRLEDTLSNQLHLWNNVQSLMLAEKPAYVLGEKVRGMLTFASPDFWTQYLESPPNRKNVKAEMKFVCTLRKRR